MKDAPENYSVSLPPTHVATAVTSLFAHKAAPTFEPTKMASDLTAMAMRVEGLRNIITGDMRETVTQIDNLLFESRNKLEDAASLCQQAAKEA